jgi:hypothetical protein
MTHDMCPPPHMTQVEKPADPYRERKLNLSSKLRDIIGFHRNDPTSPNPGTKALETAVITMCVVKLSNYSFLSCGSKALEPAVSLCLARAFCDSCCYC